MPELYCRFEVPAAGSGNWGVEFFAKPDPPWKEQLAERPWRIEFRGCADAPKQLTGRALVSGNVNALENWILEVLRGWYPAGTGRPRYALVVFERCPPVMTLFERIIVPPDSWRTSCTRTTWSSPSRHSSPGAGPCAVIPKKVIPRIGGYPADQATLGHLLLKAAEVARLLDFRNRLSPRLQPWRMAASRCPIFTATFWEGPLELASRADGSRMNLGPGWAAGFAVEEGSTGREFCRA